VALFRKSPERTMLLLMFSVFDSKAECFLRPIMSETRGLALRAFSDAVNDPSHDMHKHAEDYTLFCVGSFDQVTGEVQAWAPESIATAIAVRAAA